MSLKTSPRSSKQRRRWVDQAGGCEVDKGSFGRRLDSAIALGGGRGIRCEPALPQKQTPETGVRVVEVVGVGGGRSWGT